MKIVVLNCLLLLSAISVKSQSLAWARQLEGDESRSIAVDLSGNVYTIGKFERINDFDPGVGTFTLNPFGLSDIFISKLDANGNFVWAKQLGGSGYDYAYDIALDASGNVYSTGVFAGTADFDPSIGTFMLTAGGNSDIFISKLDPAGNFVWAKQFTTNGNDDTGYSIDLDTSGNIYSTGYFDGVGDFDPGPGTYTVNGGVYTSSYVSKLDASGNFVWAKGFRNILTNSYSEGHGINVDASGNVYTTGNFEGTIDFDPGVGNFNMVSASGYNAYVSKLDVAGNFVWAKKMDSTNDGFGTGIVTDVSGNVYTTGNFKGTTDFDPGAGTFTLSSSGSAPDVFMSKLNAAGNFVWAKKIGNVGFDYGTDITIDAFDNLYFTGYFGSSVDFDPAVGTYTISSFGQADVFISSFDASGNFIWVKQIGGSNSDYSYGIDLDASGNIYTTGFFSGTADFDPGAGTFTMSATSSTLTNPPNTFVHKMSTCNLKAVASSSVICEGTSTTLSAIGASTFYSWSNGASTATTIVTPGTTTSYTVTGNNSCGAITAIVTVSVNSLPIIGATASSPTICAGTTASLSASGATSYSWAPAGGSSSVAVVSPATTTMYTVTGTSAGCSSTQTVNLTVNALPTLTTSASQTVMCAGFTISLTASGASQYSWQPAGGSASVAVVSPTATTVYSVTGTTSGCSTTQTLGITANGLPALSAFASPAMICVGKTSTLTANGAASYAWLPAGSTSAIVVSPLSNMVYTVTGTSSAGCSKTQTLGLAVTPNPVVLASPSSTVICSGTTISLTASGAATYSWMPSGGTSSIVSVSPVATTVYTVTGYTSGCSNTNTVSVTVNPLPTISVYASPAMICLGNTSTLTASGATTYSWMPTGANSSTASVSPTTNTVYTVTAAGNSGCVKTQTVSITVSPCTGIEEAISEEDFSIYPNPANDLITIHSSTTLEKIELLSLTGQIILTEKPSGTQHQLNLADVANGVYFVVAQDGNQKVTRKKIVVQH